MCLKQKRSKKKNRPLSLFEPGRLFLRLSSPILKTFFHFRCPKSC